MLLSLATLGIRPAPAPQRQARSPRMAPLSVGRQQPAQVLALPLPHRPFISVVIPVRNEAAFIRATLEQVLGQDYDPQRFEVLVADGHSTDATRAIVREFEG